MALGIYWHMHMSLGAKLPPPRPLFFQVSIVWGRAVSSKMAGFPYKQGWTLGSLELNWLHMCYVITIDPYPVTREVDRI